MIDKISSHPVGCCVQDTVIEEKLTSASGEIAEWSLSAKQPATQNAHLDARWTTPGAQLRIVRIAGCLRLGDIGSSASVRVLLSQHQGSESLNASMLAT